MAALNFSTPDDREELARAEVYGLLAQLFYAPPGDELFAQLQVAATEAPAPGAFLEASWTELVGASRRLSAQAVRDEHEALFMGVGKPEVFLYGSYFIAGALAAFSVTSDKPHIKLIVVVASTAWGMLCGLVAGCCVFPLVAGAYQSLQVGMQIWESVAWGLGLTVMMQIIAVIRRLYVYL